MITRAPSRSLFVFAIPLVVACSYLVSPYVALYHLSAALQAGDCNTLRVAIDWGRVRESLQQEIAGTPAPVAPGIAVVKQASATTAPDDLPDFGDSFATTAVGNALSSDITPESVAAMMHDHPVTMVNTGGSLLAEARQAIDWAFFSGPRSFDVWLQPGQDPHEAPVRVHMAFTRQHGWRVIGVWLPQDLLSGGSDATHST